MNPRVIVGFTALRPGVDINLIARSIQEAAFRASHLIWWGKQLRLGFYYLTFAPPSSTHPPNLCLYVELLRVDPSQGGHRQPLGTKLLVTARLANG